MCTGGSPVANVQKLDLARPAQTQEWVLSDAAFQEGFCGGKSRNLAKLRSTATGHFNVPASIVLPFGVFDRVLGSAENKHAAADLKSLLSDLVISLLLPNQCS